MFVVPDHVPPRVFISYAHDSPDHKDMVRRFATFLHGRIGLDVHLDQWDDNRRRDWSLWAIDQLTAADFIIVIASPDYQRRADGMAPPEVGRGSHFETAIIRDQMTKNVSLATERILPVVLPGRSLDDIPTFLNAYSTTRFEIKEFTEAGVAELLAAITGEGRYTAPERGRWRADGPPEPVLLAKGVHWLASSTNVHTGDAWIDGVHYDNCILFRPTSPSEPSAFVEVDLGGRYASLTAVAGIPDDATEPFQVGHFQVRVEHQPSREYRAALGKPASVDVNVTGATHLRLDMRRPGVTGGSTRLPELAWANPTLR
jgi:SEFIR domain/NPCBM/NEW2 domain